jgi:hypothetical protein
MTFARSAPQRVPAYAVFVSLALFACSLISSLITYSPDVMPLILGLATAEGCLAAWLALTHFSDPQHQAFAVVNLAFAVWYFVPMAVATFGGPTQEALAVFSAPHVVNSAVVVYGAYAVFTFAYASLLAYGHTPRFRAFDLQTDRPVPLGLLLIYAALGLVPFAGSVSSMVAAILASRSPGSVIEGYMRNPESLSIYLLLYFAWAACLLGLAAYFSSAPVHQRRTMLVIGLGSGVAVSLALAIRSLLAIPLFPAVAVIMGRTRRRGLVRRIVVFGLLAVTLVYIADRMARFRNAGFFGEEPISQPARYNSQMLQDGDFFLELAYSRDVVPDQRPFSYESPLWVVLTGFIPHAWWPSKPTLQNSMWVMRFRMNDPSGRVSGNILPGILGQYWQVAGWVGVLIVGIWLALACSVLDRLSPKASPYVQYFLYAGSAVVFVSFRGLATSNVIPLLIAAITVGCVSAVQRWRWRQGTRRTFVPRRSPGPPVTNRTPAPRSS